jgi:hypothetical protein
MDTVNEYFNSPAFAARRHAFRMAINIAPSNLVSVVLDMAEMPPGEALQRSKQICDEITRQEPEYRSAASRDLTPLYNGSSHPKALEADEFKRRISLAEIKLNLAKIGSAGCATLYYADGNLFAGHTIEVFLDGDLRYTKAQLVEKEVSANDYAYQTSKPDAAEALAWLREARAPGDRTITGGDGKGWRGPKAIAVVQELYDLGAVRVTAVEISGRVEQSKQQDTSRLIVQLPKGKKKRAGLFAWEAKFARKSGWDPTPDDGRGCLLIWRD